MESIDRNTTSLELAEEETYDRPILQRNSYASEVSRRLYSDNETADVYFTFENSSERVSAHKCVLASASKVFRTLLYGPMAMDGDILLRDTPAEAFKIVLQFCYLDEVKLKLDNITDVMKLLDYYEMVECLELCGSFWADNWNIDDICSAYDWAINLQLSEFRDFCERKISVYSDAVLRTDGFLSCSPTVLDHILSLNSLLSDESTVLGACLKWARKQCKSNGKDPHKIENLREYLTDELYKIRYGSMTLEELSMHVDNYCGLFSDIDEYEDVLRLLCGKENLKSGKFQNEPRKQIPSVWYENKAVKCDFLTQTHHTYHGFMGHRITSVLTTNQPILLTNLQIVRIKRLDENQIQLPVPQSLPLRVAIQRPTIQNPFARVVVVPRAPPRASTHATMPNQIPIELKISEARNGRNVNDETTKLLDFHTTTLSTNTESCFRFKPKPIILRPNFEYYFQFDLPTANSTGNSYECFEIQRKIQLNQDVTVRIRAENDHFIIKKCKLIPL